MGNNHFLFGMHTRTQPKKKSSDTYAFKCNGNGDENIIFRHLNKTNISTKKENRSWYIRFVRLWQFYYYTTYIHPMCTDQRPSIHVLRDAGISLVNLLHFCYVQSCVFVPSILHIKQKKFATDTDARTIRNHVEWNEIHASMFLLFNGMGRDRMKDGVTDSEKQNKRRTTPSGHSRDRSKKNETQIIIIAASHAHRSFFYVTKVRVFFLPFWIQPKNTGNMAWHKCYFLQRLLWQKRAYKKTQCIVLSAFPIRPFQRHSHFIQTNVLPSFPNAWDKIYIVSVCFGSCFVCVCVYVKCALRTSACHPLLGSA